MRLWPWPWGKNKDDENEESMSSYKFPEDSEMSFRMGDTVKDDITGIVGMCIGRAEHVNGCLQYTIQPPVDKEGKIPNPTSVDYQRIQLVGESKAKQTLPKQKVNFELGNSVKDKISGFVGIATLRLVEITGEVFYYITPKAKDTNEYPKGVHIHASMLEYEGVGLLEVKQRDGGGPPTVGRSNDL